MPHRTGDIARDVGEVVQRGDVEAGGEQRGLVSFMRNLRRHVLESRQRALRREAFAVDEPVTNGEAERERGATEMWRELVPFLGGQVVVDLQTERGDVVARSCWRRCSAQEPTRKISR